MTRVIEDRQELVDFLNEQPGFFGRAALTFLNRVNDEQLADLIVDGKEMIAAWKEDDQETVDRILGDRVPDHMRPVVIGLLTNYVDRD